jgi:hypothetical protein
MNSALLNRSITNRVHINVLRLFAQGGRKGVELAGCAKRVRFLVILEIVVCFSPKAYEKLLRNKFAGWLRVFHNQD